MASSGLKKKSGKAGLLDKVLTPKYIFMLGLMIIFYSERLSCCFLVFFLLIELSGPSVLISQSR